MATSKGSRKRTSSARKSPTGGKGRVSGAIRVKRSQGAYRAVNTPAARELRSEIDAAVKGGLDIRKQIEDRIEQRFFAKKSAEARRRK
jgi:hypothetical protein